MDTYKKPYSALFNMMTDTINALENKCLSLELMCAGLKEEIERLKITQEIVEEYIIINDENLEEDAVCEFAENY